MLTRQQELDLTEFTVAIVTAHVSNNAVAISDVPELIRRVHEALSALGQEIENPEELVPAVSIRSSVRPDTIACLECGRRYKTLKRHLESKHKMDPNTYLTRWNLRKDYPMVAPFYSKVRSGLAKNMGLGKIPRTRGPRLATSR